MKTKPDSHQPLALAGASGAAEPQNRVTRINQRFLLYCLLGAVLFGIGVHVVHGFQIERNADALKQRAESAKSANNPNQAIQALNQYLQFRPGDVDALADLGKLMTEASQSQRVQTRAYLTLDEVLRRAPDRADADELRKQLVEVATRIGRFTDALDHLEILRAKNPKDSELSLLAAECYEASGQPVSAFVEYLQATDLNPQNVETYTALVRFIKGHPSDLPPANFFDPKEKKEKLQNGNASERDRYGLLLKTDFSPELSQLYVQNLTADPREQLIPKLLERMVNLGEPKHLAYQRRARYYLESSQLAQATADARRALELAPQDADTQMLVADVALSNATVARSINQPNEFQSQLKVARDAAAAGLTVNPNDLRFYSRLARVENESGQLEASEAILRKGLDEVPAIRKAATAEENLGLLDSEVSLRFDLANLLITRSIAKKGFVDDALISQAQKQIGLMRELTAVPAIIEFLECRILVIRQQWREAAEMMERSRPGLMSRSILRQQIDLMLGLCYERLGNVDARLSTFRRAFKDNPEWVEGRLGLAAALVTANRLDEAIEQYQALSGIPVVVPALTRLVIMREAQRPADLRNWRLANLGIQEMEKNDPNNAELPLLKAEMLLTEQKYLEAQKLLDEARSKHPDRIEYWTGSINFNLQRPDLDVKERLEVTEALRIAAEKSLGLKLPIFLSAARRVQLLPPEEARKTLEAYAARLSEFTAPEQSQALMTLSGLAERLKAEDLAYGYLARMAEMEPRNLDPRLKLIQMSMHSTTLPAGDFQKWLSQVRDIEGPNGPQGNFAAAVYILTPYEKDKQLRVKNAAKFQEDMQRARALLVQAGKDRPFWASIPRTLGSIDLMQDRMDEAMAQYRRAFDLRDRTPAVVQNIVEYLRRKKNLLAADEILGQVAQENQGTLSGELARLASQVAYQRNEFNEAIDIAKSLSLQSTNFRDKIWEGQLRWEQYKRMSQVDQKGEGGKRLLQEASKAFSDAVKLASDQPSAWFSYIFHLQEVGDTKAAEQAIREAAESLPAKPVFLKPLNMAYYYEILKQNDQAENYYLKAVEVAPDEISLRMSISDFYFRQKQLDKAVPHLNMILAPATKAPLYASNWAKARLAQRLATRSTYADTTQALEQLKEDAARARNDQNAWIESLRAQVAILHKRPTRRDRLELIKIYEELNELKLLEPAGYFHLAELYDKTDNWPKTMETMDKLLGSSNLDPRMTDWYISRLVQQESNSRENLAKALGLATSIRASAPDNYYSVSARARILGARGERKEAAELLVEYVGKLKATEENSPSGQLAQERMFMRLAAGLCEEWQQYAAVETILKRFEATNPVADRGVSLAMFYGRVGKYDEALALCQDNLSRWKPEQVALTTLVAMTTGQPTPQQQAKAEQIIQDAEKLGGDLPKYRIAFAGLRTVQGRYEEAEALNRQLLTENPQNVAVLNNLAFLLAMQAKQLNEAEEFIEQAINVAGPLVDLLDTRAVVRMALGKQDQAINDLKEAAAIEPNVVVTFHHAQALLLKGDKAEARKIYLSGVQSGLTRNRLHPMEQKKFAELVSELGVGVEQ